MQKWRKKGDIVGTKECGSGDRPNGVRLDESFSNPNPIIEPLLREGMKSTSKK